MRQEFRHKNPVRTMGDGWRDLHNSDCVAVNSDGSRCNGVIIVCRNDRTLTPERAFCTLCGQQYEPRERKI